MKMSPGKRFGIVAGILVIVGGLAWVLYQNSLSYRWDENYLSSRHDPYSTHVLAGILSEQAGEGNFTQLTDSVSLPDTVTQANYLFVGNELWGDSLLQPEILDFVRRGNTAFISTRTIPYLFFLPLLATHECESLLESYPVIIDSTASLSLIAPAHDPAQGFVLGFRHRELKMPYRWQYLDPDDPCVTEGQIQELGYLNGEDLNFFKVKYNKGHFIFHTTPLAFSNLSLLEESSLEYAEGVFSQLAPGPIFWDEWSKNPFDKVPHPLDNRRPQHRLNDESPLQFVLQEPALTWAWYLLLVLALLHLVFRTKRRQRILPASPFRTNTSLEFVDTISRLYRLQKNNKGLALLQMRMLRAHIFNQYNLPGHEFDRDLIQKLAQRTKVPEKHLLSILRLYETIKRSPTIDEATLLKFHRLLEVVYRQPRS